MTHLHILKSCLCIQQKSKQQYKLNPFPHNDDFSYSPRKEPFKNIVGKGENASNQHFLLFSQCFPPYERQIFNFGQYLLSENASNWDKINPFPNKHWFLFVFSTCLLKTMWEKEKLLVTSNFSFSHSVFHPFGELPAIFIEFEIVICKLFQFERV